MYVQFHTVSTLFLKNNQTNAERYVTEEVITKTNKIQFMREIRVTCTKVRFLSLHEQNKNDVDRKARMGFRIIAHLLIIR